MSFSGTPLGQGRRLDHSTFLGKPASTANSLHSYAYGAPAFGSRSPPKPTSPSRDRVRPQPRDNDPDESEHAPALIRFARLKERETVPDPSSRPGGPKVINSPPHPEKWSVKDTSVNIATAFIQAASTDMSAPQNHNHNGAWASTSSSSRTAVPRSTSVEFESNVPAPATANRRLAPPPNKLSRPPVSATGRKTTSKPPSRLVVPSSEGEEDRHVRGKSPFEVGVNIAKQAIGAAAFYVRQRSHEPEDLSREHSGDHSQELPPANGRADGNDSSYSYTQEERSYQEAQQKAAHRKARMSEDNKAYKPLSDDEESDYVSDDGKRHKKRKSKKGAIGGPLTNLPVVTSGKRRKKRRNRNANGGLDGGADDMSGSEDDDSMDMSQSAHLRASVARTSVPPLSHGSTGRHSREPQDRSVDDSAGSMYPGLDSIPEIQEDQLLAAEQALPIRQPSQARRSRSRTPGPHTISRSPAFSIGGLLGKIVHLIVKLCLLIFSGFVSVMSMLTFLFGQVFGTSFDILLRRPVGWARGSGPLLRLLVPALVVFAAWYALQNASIAPYIPSLSFPSHTPVYQPPAAPPANMGEFSNRLTTIESTLSGLAVDNEQNKRKVEDGAKQYSELLGQVTHLDSRLAQEIRKGQDANARAQNAINAAVSAIKHEMEVLQSQMAAQQKKQAQQQKQRPAEGTADDEARLKLKVLQERFVAVEGSSKEALELAKKALAAPPQAATPGPGAAWWNKLASGTGSKSELQIKSADGQDVSALITHLVDSAVSRINKDGIAKADFAMQSAGAQVIPALTSPALEIPRGFASQVWGLFTGKGTFGFRPPITALHYDTHPGVCWPFAGTQGQLGVHLVAPVYIDEITIDHVAKEVAFDMATAPRHMEVWGMVEGEANIQRVAEWKADLAARREAGASDAVEDEEPYPPTLPKNPEYVRLVNFTYDIEAPNNVQTFPVDPEIRNLGVDFGIVVLRILDNWGRKEFTCLYRFRVHGQRLSSELPMPFSAAGVEEEDDGR